MRCKRAGSGFAEPISRWRYICLESAFTTSYPEANTCSSRAVLPTPVGPNRKIRWLLLVVCRKFDILQQHLLENLRYYFVVVVFDLFVAVGCHDIRKADRNTRHFIHIVLFVDKYI